MYPYQISLKNVTQIQEHLDNKFNFTPLSGIAKIQELVLKNDNRTKIRIIQGVQRKWLQIQYSSCNHFLCTPCIQTCKIGTQWMMYFKANYLSTTSLLLNNLYFKINNIKSIKDMNFVFFNLWGFLHFHILKDL